MKAMLLAAGEGTRLRPMTLTLPKPMVPIVGRPLLERTLLWLSGQGVTEAAINLYHRPQAIPNHFGSEFAGVRLHYFFEDTLRGTAGGVQAAKHVLQDAPFFVIYGDNLIEADLGRLASYHAAQGGEATISLFHHPNPTAAGIVGLADDGRVTQFVEKPTADQVFSDLANAGVYVLNPSVLNAIPSDRPSDFGRDIFPDLLAQGVPLYGTRLGGYLQDTGTPEAYRQASFDLLAGRTGVSFTDPSLWISPKATVGRGVTFAGRNVVEAGVLIGDGAAIRDCLLLPGASVPPSRRLSDTIRGPDFAFPLLPFHRT